jgi:hypothetical protein
VYERVVKKDLFFISDQGGFPEELQRKILENGAITFSSGLMEMYKIANSGLGFKPGESPFGVSDKSIIANPSAHSIPKDAPWKAPADKVVQRLLEGGIINKLSKNYFPSYIDQLVNPALDDKPKPFNMEHYVIPVAFLVITHAISCFIFLSELKFGREMFKHGFF